MPLDEILRNSAPAIGGLLVAAAGLAFAHFERRKLRRRREEAARAAGKPAE
jgi:hypothetical protein